MSHIMYVCCSHCLVLNTCQVSSSHPPYLASACAQRLFMNFHFTPNQCEPQYIQDWYQALIHVFLTVHETETALPTDNSGSLEATVTMR